MKIDKNKLEYANEHPKTKKFSKGQSKKLKKGQEQYPLVSNNQTILII